MALLLVWEGDAFLNVDVILARNVYDGGYRVAGIWNERP
jgi:hypothetical protein